VNTVDTSPGFGLSVIAVFLGTFAGSLAAGYFGLAALTGLSAGLLTVTDGTQVLLPRLLMVVGLAALVRSAVGTLVVCWLIGHAGAWVSFPRAFCSLLLGDVAGQLITIAWVVDQRGGLPAGAGVEWLVLPLVGVVLSAMLISAPPAPQATAS
jgi:hypothetical protein